MCGCRSWDKTADNMLTVLVIVIYNTPRSNYTVLYEYNWLRQMKIFILIYFEPSLLRETVVKSPFLFMINYGDDDDGNGETDDITRLQ